MQKKKQEEMNEEKNENSSLLVGYARKSNAGGALKLSVNTDSFADCQTYITSDGQVYAQLLISMVALNKVLSGDRAVTTISQIQD